MMLTPTEKQQVEAAVDAFFASPNVQAAITGFNTQIETQGIAFADKVINNAKMGGLLGGLFNAFKGSAESELNALVQSLPPAALTQMEVGAAESELKAILGA